jgi:hypothetical protein
MCISHKNDTAYPERDAKGVRVDKSSKKSTIWLHKPQQVLSPAAQDIGTRNIKWQHCQSTLWDYSYIWFWDKISSLHSTASFVRQCCQSAKGSQHID